MEIRCPERGRKLTIHHTQHVIHIDLEIRCPERGRKPTPPKSMTTQPVFGNKMPREGTETSAKLISLFTSAFYLEIRCPERGRKPYFEKLMLTKYITYLEIRCPERGRKLYLFLIRYAKSIAFGNKMPREGTETYMLFHSNV